MVRAIQNCLYSNVDNSNKTQLKNQGKFDEKKIQIGGKSPLALCCSFLLADDGRRGGLVADELCLGVARAVFFIPLCEGTLCWGGRGPCGSSRGHTRPSQRVPSPAQSSSRAPRRHPGRACALRRSALTWHRFFAIFSSFIYLRAQEGADGRGKQPTTGQHAPGQWWWRGLQVGRG